MILVPLFDLKFLFEFAAGDVGTSNRRHWIDGVETASDPLYSSGTDPANVVRDGGPLSNA